MLIDWFTVGAQAVNFLILVWLMKRFLYAPILAAIDAREKKIGGELQHAADVKRQAEQEREELRRQTEALQRQCAELLQAAAADASVQRQHLLEETRQESDELRSKSAAALNAEQTELRREIVSRMQQETFALARKTLADLADTTLEDRMLEVLILRLADLNDAQKDRLLPPQTNAGAREVVLRSAFALTATQRARSIAAFSSWPCGGVPLRFETAPDLICGIELLVNGQKLIWNVTAYLTTVQEKVRAPVAPDQFIPSPGGDAQHAA